jgi:hypothetical protein
VTRSEVLSALFLEEFKLSKLDFDDLLISKVHGNESALTPDEFKLFFVLSKLRGENLVECVSAGDCFSIESDGRGK